MKQLCQPYYDYSTGVWTCIFYYDIPDYKQFKVHFNTLTHYRKFIRENNEYTT